MPTSAGASSAPSQPTEMADTDGGDAAADEALMAELEATIEREIAELQLGSNSGQPEGPPAAASAQQQVQGLAQPVQVPPAVQSVPVQVPTAPLQSVPVGAAQQPVQVPAAPLQPAPVEVAQQPVQGPAAVQAGGGQAADQQVAASVPLVPAVPGEHAMPAEPPTVVVSDGRVVHLPPPCSTFSGQPAPGQPLVVGPIVPTPHTMFWPRAPMEAEHAAPAQSVPVQVALQPEVPAALVQSVPVQPAQQPEAPAPLQSVPVPVAHPLPPAPLQSVPVQVAQPAVPVQQPEAPAAQALQSVPVQVEPAVQPVQPTHQPEVLAAPLQSVPVQGPAGLAQSVPVQVAQPVVQPAQPAQQPQAPAGQALQVPVQGPASSAQSVPAQVAQPAVQPVQPAQQPQAPAAQALQSVPVQASAASVQSVPMQVPTATQASTPQDLAHVIDQTAGQTAAANPPAQAVPQVASSTTHRKEYMSFLRAAGHPNLACDSEYVFIYDTMDKPTECKYKNIYQTQNHEIFFGVCTTWQLRERLDPAVAAMFADRNKRKDLFNMWLTHAQDFGQVSLEISRVNSQSLSCQATTVTWSKKQLEQSGRYSEQEITALIDRLTKEEKYIDDPNFPGVEHLRRYQVVDDISATNEKKQENRQVISNAGNITRAEGVHLTGEGLKHGVILPVLFTSCLEYILKISCLVKI